MAEQNRIRELRNARGVAKRQITILEAFVADITPETDFYLVEARFESLSRIVATFEAAQSELERIDPTEVAEPDEGQLTERESFENRFIQVKARLQRAIKESPNNSFDPPHNSTLVETSSDLPKMDIPDFNGTYSDYTTFMEIFDTLVHQNPSRQLTNIRRLNILRSHCKGMALDVIGNLKLTNENYEVARAMLAERFDNPRKNFEESVATMWQLEKATTAKGLRTLTDGIKSQLLVLRRLGNDQQIFDGILMHMAMDKLDSTSRTKWEEHQANSKEIPPWAAFESFLEKRCTVWEAVALNKAPIRPQRPIEAVKKTYLVAHTAAGSCSSCHKGCKSILECKEFKSLAPKRKFFRARELNLCYCCLKTSHETPCEAPRCIHCGRLHHSLLHYGKYNTANKSFSSQNASAMTQSHTNISAAQSNEGATQAAGTSVLTLAVKNVSNTKMVDLNSKYCFLATAVLLVKNSMDEYVPLRAIFDGASQASFITANAANILGLPKLNTRLEITGVHGSARVLRKAVKLEFKSASSEFGGELYLPINQYFNETHPATAVDTASWGIPKNVKLADPSFNTPGAVDILLNAHLAYEWQSVGQIKLSEGLPFLQKTVLGWVVVGNYGNDDPIAPLLEKFWTVEEIDMNERVTLTSEENACERHYVENVTRKPDGRFVVKLPFRMDPANLGNSYNAAHRRFKSLCAKLSKDGTLKGQYVAFMDEYRQLGHCKPEVSTGIGYVIPHFHVVNPDSTTTKLRVVFDASAPSSNGFSLNDALMVGPTIQRDLFTHLIEFRCLPIVLTGDISKMYRQIDVDEEDQKWQKVIWGDENDVEILQLTTITYGTGPASFLATRVLKQLADEEETLLAGAKAIRENMYVDDLLTGADTPEEVIQLFEEVKAILAKGQLPIRKFCSNSAEVMAAIPEELHGTMLTVGDKAVVKALGQLWLPLGDILTYHHEILNKPVTKRGITSVVASIYDPVGIASPTIVLGKILLQRIWVLGVNWDESLPQAEATLWLKLREEFIHLRKISVPRYVLPMSKVKKVTLHGFGDASKTAYGVVFYVRAEDESCNITVRLLAAKSRVAPLKTVSLPRLELLSGQLLAKLCQKLKPILKFDIAETFLWLDASIALTWIAASPHKWTSFVATRVTRIQNWVPDVKWRHVPTDQNPADIASRGMLPSKLAECSLWLNGPTFLMEPPNAWPDKFQQPNAIPEVAPPIKVFATRVELKDLVAQSKYHSWKPVQGVFGYVRRFLTLTRAKAQQRKALEATNAPPPYINRRNVPEHKSKPSGVRCQPQGEYLKYCFPNNDTRKFFSQHSVDLRLDAIEMMEGLKTAVKLVQRHHFKDLVVALDSKGSWPRSLKEIAKLHPFMDKDGLIRVGGRLAHSVDLSYGQKYPLLLPFEHPLTRSLFLHIHHDNMHAGPRAMLGAVYTQFWPLKAKVMANAIFRSCLRCQWINPTPATQLMGQLPRCRVSIADRPFASTGVDYFEPLWISQKGRGRKPVRAYVCLFVCMTTKAVHMELVDDLSTPGFLNAFQSFVSRRGTPATMHSDNGRNFCGARNLLYAQQQLNGNENWTAVYEWCRSNGIQWQLIPPRTPHQGGLWEAAVKSAKYHLIRAIGQTSLYRSEMETVIWSVEAILNSRPLIPVSPHPEDGSPLTPGHFLIGEPLKTLPEPYLADHTLTNLERYKRVVAVKQIFWQKWSREYLSTLMNRYKWTEEKPNLKVDDYVLLVDKNTKAHMWRWGRIIEVRTAKDGKVRSAKVKTVNGEYERGISELCPLPFEDNPSSA